MSALRQTLAEPMLSPAELQFLRTVADDTEDAPWMVMNDRQWRDASALFWSLEAYAQTHRVPWYPGGMLPLTYLVQGEPERKTVAPDVFAATVPVRGRSSLPVDEEGMPPFVLGVVSTSSVRRDLEEKTEIYRLLGADDCGGNTATRGAGGGRYAASVAPRVSRDAQEHHEGKCNLNTSVTAALGLFQSHTSA